MISDKVKTFMTLAGQATASRLDLADENTRKLGAQLLLSEVLEYCIKGLGVTPVFGDTEIHAPDELHYKANAGDPNPTEMLDGLADVAYTMYWNALAFGLPLERGFELVCDNNLEKFVELENWEKGDGELESDDWHCNRQVEWPEEVVRVEVVEVTGKHYAVGKDARGKVRKPSTYKSVNLRELVESNI